MRRLGLLRPRWGDGLVWGDRLISINQNPSAGSFKFSARENRMNPKETIWGVFEHQYTSALCRCEQPGQRTVMGEEKFGSGSPVNSMGHQREIVLANGPHGRTRLFLDCPMSALPVSGRSASAT